MAFWHLLLIVGVLGFGLISALFYLLRQGMRTHGDRVDAWKARVARAIGNAARRLFPPRPKRRGARSEPRATSTPAPASALSPQGRVTAQPFAKGPVRQFGQARHDPEPGENRPSLQAPAAPSGPAVGLAGTAFGIPEGHAMRRAAHAIGGDGQTGPLAALRDSLEHGDLSIEDFLKAVALEREECERQMRFAEVLHEDRTMLEQDSAYQQARAQCLAAIGYQEWALGLRENLRHTRT